MKMFVLGHIGSRKFFCYANDSYEKPFIIIDDLISSCMVMVRHLFFLITEARFKLSSLECLKFIFINKENTIST